MKTLEWQRFFADQRARHGKVIFSVAELANSAQTSLHAVNTELGRLVRRGIIHRFAQGRYGSNEGVNPEDILPAIDPGAYITGFYALLRRNLVTQVPSEVTCFTNRRHNRKSGRITPAGILRFVHVPPAIYARPEDPPLASAEQGLCDFVWLCLRDEIDPRSLVTFSNLSTLHRRRLNKIVQRYPASVQSTVWQIPGVIRGG